mgnify:FL=1
MNTAKVIKELYDKIDILSESKQMHNRFYVSRANRLIEKLKLHHAKTKTK